jgi:hypothetical protein
VRLQCVLSPSCVRVIAMGVLARALHNQTWRTAGSPGWSIIHPQYTVQQGIWHAGGVLPLQLAGPGELITFVVAAANQLIEVPRKGCV